MSRSVFGNELQDQQSRLMLPERVIGKERGIPWQATFQMRAELCLNFGALADEIASMSHEELEVSIRRVPDLFDKTESIDRGAKNSHQIVIVGFEIAVLGGPVMG